MRFLPICLSLLCCAAPQTPPPAPPPELQLEAQVLPLAPARGVPPADLQAVTLRVTSNCSDC